MNGPTRRGKSSASLKQAKWASFVNLPLKRRGRWGQGITPASLKLKYPDPAAERLANKNVIEEGNLEKPGSSL
jgi:hypothetical protein